MAKDASALREIRTRLGMSQAECATALDVALETFRTWDAGRRPAPEAIVDQARTLKAKRRTHDRVPLQVLADELHVHVRTPRMTVASPRRSGRERSSASSPRQPREMRRLNSWRSGIAGPTDAGRRRLVAVCRVALPEDY
jgi:DNA-binding XRE family transcriptional regulator